MSLQQRALWVFLLQPIAFGAWIPRIPEIQSKLALDPVGLALALAGGPVGTLITLTFAGRLVNALGARHTIILFYPVFLGAMLLPLMAPSLPLLALALALMSASISVLELGLNIAADEVEKRTGSILMSKAHGFWSLGLMTGTALGAIAAGAHVTPVLASLLISVVVLPLALWIAWGLPRHERAAEGTPGKITLPHPILLGICLYVFGTTPDRGRRGRLVGDLHARCLCQHAGHRRTGRHRLLARRGADASGRRPAQAKVRAGAIGPGPSPRSGLSASCSSFSRRMKSSASAASCWSASAPQSPSPSG